LIRRIVTAHDDTGKTIVLLDGPAPNVRVRPQTGIVSTLLWTTDTAPARYARDDRGETAIGTAPPPAGSILRVVEFPPYDGGADNAAMLAAMGIHADTGGRRPARHEFMHATDSVDYAIVLDGEIDMLLDDEEVHLRAGDVLVQQGTNHAWVNRGERPCRIAFVLLDAAGAPLIPG
jgi:mannose-6-phosphate isomerase-like protein (cupin superfamily)